MPQLNSSINYLRFTSIEFHRNQSSIFYEYTLPITNDKFNSTANYQMRIYTSGCYYLDKNNQRQFNGLILGLLIIAILKLSDIQIIRQTFASGFLILSLTIDWNYTFINVDFVRNKTM